MPLLELGVVMRVGRVPVVLGRLRDPRVIRSALQSAIQAAREDPGDIAGQQDIGLLRELLSQVTGDDAAVPLCLM